MALAVSVAVGQAADFVASGSKTRTLTAAVPAGATLFAGFVCDNNGTGTTTPTPLMAISGGTFGNGGSPTWTIRQRGSGNGTGTGVVGCLAWCEVPPGSGGLASGQTITVTLDAGAASIAAKDIELWYVANSRPSTITPVSAFDTANATFSVAIAPTAAGQDVIVWGGRESSTNGAITDDADTTNGTWASTTPSGLTTAQAGGVIAQGVTGFRSEKIVTAAGTQTWNPTLASGGGDWVAFAMVLEERIDERVGTATPSNLLVGTSQVDAVYLGTARVF